MKKRVKNLFLSLLLIPALLLPMSMPVSAEENTNKEVVDAAIIFADLHTNQDDYKDGHIQSIMKKLKSTELPFSSVISGGDAFSVCDDDHDRFPKDLGITSKITQSIRTGLSNDSISVEYVWSDHDRYADIFFSESDSEDDLYQKRTSRFVYGAGSDGKYGNEDDDNYYVYALSMADTSDALRYGLTSRTSEQVQAVISDFENTVKYLDKSKPLFIIAHQPLFYRRGDNGHASLWYESINKIAKTMDVAYFFGHNHKYDNLNDYYYEKGSIMTVATLNGGSKTYTDMPLNFSHICAGYMEPVSTDSYSDTTRKSTVIGITIYEDRIQYATYDANGLYDLDEYGNKKFAALNVSIKRKYTTPAIIDKLSMTDNKDYYLAVSNVLNYFTGYAITIPSDAKDTGVKVSLPRPLPGSEVPLAVYRVSDDAKTVTRINTSLKENGNALSFTSDSDGYYFIGTDLIPDAAPETSFATGVAHPQEDIVYYVPADSFEDGQKYLIVGEKGIDGEKIAYLNNNGVEGYEPVSISDSQIVCKNIDAVWTASGNDTDGYILQNSDNYIGGELGDTVKSSPKSAARLIYSKSDVRLHTKASSPMYLYYSTSGNEQWKFINSKNSSTSSRQMWIYKAVIGPIPQTGGCEHAFSSETFAGTYEVCGYTINTCVYCGYSNFGNFTPPLTDSSDQTTLNDENNETIDDTTIYESAGPTYNPKPSGNNTTYEEKTIYVPVDNFENNGKYLLIGEESIGGTPLAHLNKNGDEGAQKVTINTTPLVTDTATYKDGYIELSNTNAVWTASGDASKGFVLSNNGKYIGTKSDNDGDTIRSSSSNAAKVVYDASADRLKTASGTTKYLYYTTYSGEYWKWATSANSSTSSRNMMIYKEITVKVAK